MKREIKFRAWDDYHKQMIVDYLVPDGDFEFKGYDKTNNIVGITDVMQFTGLKDKNGVDIYEGDIVAWPYIDPSNRLYSDEENGRAVVIFSNGSFCLDTYPEIKSIQGWCKSHQSTYFSNYGCFPIIESDTVLWITGNIHQTPQQ